MNVLVTGAAGFAGRYAAAELARRGAGVLGAHRTAPPPDGLPVARWIRADLCEPEQARRAVADAAPDAVLHLAGQPRVGFSFSDPAGTFRLNTRATLNLLEAVRREAPKARLILVSSCEVYGEAPADRLPLRESEPMRPLSPYAVSKAAAEFFALAYHRTHHLHVAVLRPFNHTGPGQAPHFVCADFARQIALAEAGRAPAVLSVGRTSFVREFLDVRDVAAAYADAVASAPAGSVHNVACGRGVTIRAMLDLLLAQARRPIAVREDTARHRVADVPALVGDASALGALTGWKPVRTLERTLSDLLAYWRERVEREKNDPAPRPS
jgi:GDP-4-dehydro-6-deoxy-D-mannose reductase